MISFAESTMWRYRSVSIGIAGSVRAKLWSAVAPHTAKHSFNDEQRSRFDVGPSREKLGEEWLDCVDVVAGNAKKNQYGSVASACAERIHRAECATKRSLACSS